MGPPPSPIDESSSPVAPPPAAQLESAVRSVGRGTIALVISTALFVVLGFVSRVTIAHLVSVQQWGEFSLGLALSSLLGIVVALGLPNAVSRALSYESDWAARRRIVRSTLLAALASGAGGSAVIFVLAGSLAGAFHDPNLTVVFQLFAPSIGFTVVSSVLAAYFQGMERVGANAVFNLGLNPALFLAFLGLSFALHGRFVGILAAYLLSAGVACLALAFYTWRALPKALERSVHATEADPSGHVSLLAMTISLFGAGSLNLLTQYADTLILGVFWTTAVVGLYSAGMTLARLFVAGSTALLYIYLPVSTRLRRSRDFGALRSTYVTSARWVTVMTLPVFVVFFFDPAPTLGAVFGGSYTSAVLALRILSVASFLSVIIGPSNAALSGLGHPVANMAAAGTSLGMNVALSLLLIPTWGLLGAAVAWSVARLVYTNLCLLVLWKEYRVTPFASHYLRPIALTLLVLIPVFVLLPVGAAHPLLLLPLAALAIGVTLAAIPLTNSVDPGDLILLDSVLRTLHLGLPSLRRFLERHAS